MTSSPQKLTLTACALAASLFLAACGGGSGTDTVAPTVAIGSVAAASTVTFTFTFSEDVGSSFTADDVAVVGGTKGATVTKVDATHYTLTVTPDAGATAVTASLAAGKFTDAANNANAASATNTFARTAVPSIDFAGTVGFDPFEGLVSAAVADDPVFGAANKVAKLVKGTGGQPWAGVTIYTSGSVDSKTVAGADLSTNKLVTVRSYTSAPVGTKMTLKLEDAAAPGVNIAAETVTTKRNEWETLTFNFSSLSTGVFNATATYNKASVFPAFSIPGGAGSFNLTGDTAFYLDDLNYPVATAPLGAAATPPSRGAADVKSIYSDAYTGASAVTGLNLRPDWGQSTAVSEVLIGGNKTQKYTSLNYEGIQFDPIDVSGMKTLHIDIWTPDLATVDLAIIAPNGEQKVTVPLTKSGWNTVEIPMSSYTTPNKAAIFQIKFDVQPASGTLYFDNLYFYKDASGPTVAAATPPARASGDVKSIYSDAYTGASAVTGLNLRPDWGQATAVSEVLIAGNKTQKYANLNYEGIQFDAIDVSAMQNLHIDVWTQDLSTVDLFVISPGNGEAKVTVPLTKSGWNVIDIPMSSFTGTNKASVSQMKFDVQPASGTLYFDNLYFYKAAASSTLAFASDYTGATVSAGKSKEGGNIGYYIDNGAGVVTQEWWAGLASNMDGGPPTNDPNFYFGFGVNNTGTKPGYMGAYVNAPANGAANVSAYSSVEIYAWGNDELMNTHPTLTYILTAPLVSGCKPELKSSAVVAAGGAQKYTLPLSGFTVQTVCGLANAAAILASGVTAVHVQVLGSNFQYVTGTAPNYANGLNLGKVTFK